MLQKDRFLERNVKFGSFKENPVTGLEFSLTWRRTA